MTALLFGLAAILLIICLVQGAAILGLRSMLQSANDDLVSLGRLVDVCQERTDKLDALADKVSETIETLTQQRDKAVDDATRLAKGLGEVTASLQKAQNQYYEARDQRDEYKEMLCDIARHFVLERDLLDEVTKAVELD